VLCASRRVDIPALQRKGTLSNRGVWTVAERGESPRAEELLAEIWRQRLSRLEAGKAATAVVLSMENYRKIQRYHATLGELPDSEADYISRYRIFDLSVFIDNQRGCVVE